MIDEKKLIERLQRCVDTSDNSNFTNGLLSAIDIANQQPKIGEWIPCSEPPEHSGEVLIFNGKHYSVGYYTGEKWVNAIHPVEWQEIHHE